ncbi:glycosyltransferase family 25 protein [Rhizobiaceae bacterium n13]|uniref:Glycosyltransferase family 25 protein n=1 Tax=Ferirhizobium litorale TaxID=2927786 RepID=A0AAE3TZK0_9HYPH|nr:glycosyltransferase family 25 protein [Fererhizobium litorale]MDI7860921.1 glycosyltransferase family 25 protein [Fererhizobium litorale]MDI7921069.1 glycosyltransferase family 25 protein [Fererhizobium litorale]
MISAVTINLAVAEERMQFQAAQLGYLGLHYERISAIEAEDAPGLRPAAYWDTWERPLKDAEKACFLSHRAAWEKVVAGGKPLLILEDDAVLSDRVPHLLEKLSSATGIDLVTLETRGRKKFVAKAGHPDILDLPIRRLYQDRSGAAAYVLWPSGARKLLRRTEDKAGLADAVICAAYDLATYQADPACALQIDRCTLYGIREPVATTSAIDAGEAPTASTGSGPTDTLAFKARRIRAQLRLGFHQLLKSPLAEHREIAVDPGDFSHLDRLTRLIA